MKLKPEELRVLLVALPELRAATSRTQAEAAQSILERWEITAEELTKLVDENPSLRGMLFGYVAELKFAQIWLDHPEVSYAVKPDDHDRKKKGDRLIIYRKREISIEVKSLQTNSIRKNADGSFSGKAQCDGSDRRAITFKDGSQLNTTCLLAGEFDLLAVNCFAFRGTWEFVFARNRDLPPSTWRGYTPEQREQLLASLVPVTWPPKAPFYSDPFAPLDRIAKDRKR